MKLVFIFLFLLISYSHGWSQKGDETHYDLQECKTHEDRVKFAQFLVRYYKFIDAHIPNLKPDEETWVKKEYNRLSSLNDVRIRELVESREYLISESKKEIQELIEQAKDLTTTRISPRGEFIAWVWFNSKQSQRKAVWERIDKLIFKNHIESFRFLPYMGTHSFLRDSDRPNTLISEAINEEILAEFADYLPIEEKKSN